MCEEKFIGIEGVEFERRFHDIKEEIRILVIGDPHFKSTNKLQTDDLRKEFIKLARRLKPDFIVNLGDTLHNHDKIHMRVLYDAIEFFEDLSEISPLFVLIGNHDRPSNNTFLTDEINMHPFVGIKEKGNINIVDDATLIYDFNGVRFGFVPYVPTGRFNEALSIRKFYGSSERDIEDKISVVFAHQHFAGVINESRLIFKIIEELSK